MFINIKNPTCKWDFLRQIYKIFICFIFYCNLHPKCNCMKWKCFTLLLIWVLSSCKQDDSINRNNPYLTDPYINFTIDLSLPQYNALNYPGNHLIISNYGIRGIVIYNENNSNYHVHELSDPNHPPNDCSAMEVEGIHATCPCPTESNNPNSYNIITGQHLANPGGMYPMQRYKASRNGNSISVSNQ